MKRRRRGLTLPTFLAVLALLANLASADAATWKTLAPKGGGFSVLLPGVAKAGKTVEKDKEGSVTSNFDWSLETEQAYYVVGYQEHPAAVARLINPDAMLDEAVKGLAGDDKKIKITSDKSVKSGGYTGREVKATVPDGVLLQAKLFWVKRRLYMAVTGYPAGESGSARDANKFLSSFKLIGKP